MPPQRNRILEGRGKNAIAALFSKTLIVPKIFFDANWPTRESLVDVLAVDRSGAGDVHVVEIILDARQIPGATRELSRVRAQYKYLAYFSLSDEDEPVFDPEADPDQRLYAPDGLGRIGTICLYQGDPGNALQADVMVQPERFRVPHNFNEQIDRYLEKHVPDVTIRA